VILKKNDVCMYVDEDNEDNLLGELVIVVKMFCYNGMNLVLCQYEEDGQTIMRNIWRCDLVKIGEL